MKSFKTIAPKEEIRDLLAEGFQLVVNPNVKYEIADVVIIDYVEKKVCVEKAGRNVITNMLEINTNYLDIPLEKLVTIP